MNVVLIWTVTALILVSSGPPGHAAYGEGQQQHRHRHINPQGSPTDPAAGRRRSGHIRRRDEIGGLDYDPSMQEQSDFPSDFYSRISKVSTPKDCPTDCTLRVSNLHRARSEFRELAEERGNCLVYFKLFFPEYSTPIMETYPYMGASYRASEWTWAAQGSGRRLLGLPLDNDVLSLYILSKQRSLVDLHISTTPTSCLVMFSPECRLHVVRSLIVNNVTNFETFKQRRDYVCHHVINNTDIGTSRLVHRCCETDAFRGGDLSCQVYTTPADEMFVVDVTIKILSIIATLFSPLFLLRIKIALNFDSATKFFRASLKHGITGQRNYVIRISSRQLINLDDRSPFSIPRTLFRFVCHAYGEGRCCIHWWREWRHQPAVCRESALCRRCWLVLCRIFGVLIVYPAIIYGSLALYAPKILQYRSLVNYTQHSEMLNPVELDINVIVRTALTTSTYEIATSVWILFSFCAFLYAVTILSWPNHPLERCLMRYEGKRPSDQPNALYRRISQSYKSVLLDLTYGRYRTKRHFFRIRCLPWGFRRVCHFVLAVLSQVPVVNICFTTFMYDAKIFDTEAADQAATDHDEAVDKLPVSRPSGRMVGKLILASIVWIGFVSILAGFCTTVYLMIQFLFNVGFFVVIGIAINATSILPWICFAAVTLLYLNDLLTEINAEHRAILKLIDENSPRISAVEEPDESAFRADATTSGGSGIQILKTHNLGAVKFIDGDNCEFVSKELYYNVCADLRCGWSRSVRRILNRMALVVPFLAFLFVTLWALSSFIGSNAIFWIISLIGSGIPKLIEIYTNSKSAKPDVKSVWAKIIPDILDRHIRVDRSQQSVDEVEEELMTYDVRPVGLLEIDYPRASIQRTLRLWKFPWNVACDQQTQSAEPFVLALANKLSTASFLRRVVTRVYSCNFDDDAVLRQWCLMIETCIVEGSTKASTINGTPLDAIQLFPLEYQPLVSQFEAGNTIDMVVDNINRELYGPFTKGVLVTIGNMSFALCKLDSQILAFNSGCHGDQITDLFGAVLIVADFNTQNIQSTIKYLIDPYKPDSVPVYSLVPVEGFVFRSTDILEMESVI